MSIPSLNLSNISILNYLHCLYAYLLKAAITQVSKLTRIIPPTLYACLTASWFSSSLSHDLLYVKFVVPDKEIYFLSRTLIFLALSSSYTLKYSADGQSHQLQSLFKKSEVCTIHFVNIEQEKIKFWLCSFLRFWQQNNAQNKKVSYITLEGYI